MDTQTLKLRKQTLFLLLRAVILFPWWTQALTKLQTSNNLQISWIKLVIKS